jgi:hypothetical protein
MEKGSDFTKTTFEAKKAINSKKIMMKSELGKGKSRFSSKSS